MYNYIYKARKTNQTMKYTKDKEYCGNFASTSWADIMSIINDIDDKVLVCISDFDYIRKEKTQ